MTSNDAKQSGLGIAGFVVGLVSFFIFPLILGVIGAVLSGVALGDYETKKGLPIAGLVLSIVSIIYGIIKGIIIGVWL